MLQQALLIPKKTYQRGVLRAFSVSAKHIDGKRVIIFVESKYLLCTQRTRTQARDMNAVVVYFFALFAALQWPQIFVVAQQLPSSWVRGTNFFAFHTDDARNPATLSELANLPTALPGINTVALQFMWAQDNATSSYVYATETISPSAESLLDFIQTAHSSGLAVYLKPIVVANDGTEMAQLNPANVTAWFESYASLLLPLAALAQQTGVERLALGIELQILATASDNLDYWKTLIQNVRLLFKGTLTSEATRFLVRPR